MEEKEKTKISVEQAKKVLQINNGMVHTFLNPGFGLVGGNHTLESIHNDLESAAWIEICGDQAKAMKHGIATIPSEGCNQSSVLFIETNMEKLEELEGMIRRKEKSY